MKKIFTLAIALLILAACSNQKESLRIEIDGWGNDSILLVHIDLKGKLEEIGDTIVAQNGVVTYNASAGDTTLVIMIPFGKSGERIGVGTEAKRITTVVYPGSKESIVGKAFDNRVEYTSSGNDPMFEDAAKVRLETMAHLLHKDSVNRLIEKHYSNPEKQEEINGWFEQRGEASDKVREITMRYVKENPSSQLAGFYAQDAKYEDKVAVIDGLDPKVRAGVFKYVIEYSYIRAKKYELTQEAKVNMVEGKPAPAFTLKNEKGEDVSLSDFRGKWVVIDFWGTWCGWCIKGFPDMKEAYEKHKGDKFEIIGIACKDTQEKWLAGLEEYQLPWVNLINQEALNEDVSVKYAVEGYPTKIIINPEGEIAKIVVGEDPIFYTELEKLLK